MGCSSSKDDYVPPSNSTMNYGNGSTYVAASDGFSVPGNNVPPPSYEQTVHTQPVPKRPIVERKISSFRTMDDLDEALKKGAVYEDINIMLFIDWTASNKWTGKMSYHGKPLHDIHMGSNRYLDAISSMRKLFETDQNSKMAVYTYGSGKAAKCQGNVDYHGEFKSIDETKKWYMEFSQNPENKSDMAGPTTLKYILDEAQRVTDVTGRYHIVVVLTDGDPTDSFKATDIGEVYDASKNPLSIVVVGLGDGVYNKDTDEPEFPFYEGLDDNDEDKMGVPKGTLEKAERRYGKPKYDNLQFINLEKDVLHGSEMDEENQEKFFVKAFGEVPRQYELVKKVLGYSPKYGSFEHPAPEGWESKKGGEIRSATTA